MSAGIDYGRFAQTNRNVKTGIHYGVIAVSAIEQAWADSLEGFDGTCVMITRSPWFTKTKFCSPCAPGAGDLDNPDDDGAETYCFGHDWFDEGKAPYPVYSVETKELVQP